MADYVPGLGVHIFDSFEEELLPEEPDSEPVACSLLEIPSSTTTNNNQSQEHREEYNNRTPQGGKKPKRGYANKRERVRTENVNAGFDRLRKLIPTDPIDRKLSKIEVLRLAVSYIKHLYNLTRASSCLEAEQRNTEKSTTGELSDNEDDREISNRQPVFRETRQSTLRREAPPVLHTKNSTKRSDNRQHVCTFCLMMTKSNNTNASPSSSSTKRK